MVSLLWFIEVSGVCGILALSFACVCIHFIHTVFTERVKSMILFEFPRKSILFCYSFICFANQDWSSEEGHECLAERCRARPASNLEVFAAAVERLKRQWGFRNLMLLLSCFLNYPITPLNLTTVTILITLIISIILVSILSLIINLYKPNSWPFIAFVAVILHRFLRLCESKFTLEQNQRRGWMWVFPIYMGLSMRRSGKPAYY
jgi:hypothetical protein